MSKQQIKQQLQSLIEMEMFNRLEKLGLDQTALVSLDMFEDCKDEAVFIALALKDKANDLSFTQISNIYDELVNDFINANFKEYIHSSSDMDIDSINISYDESNGFYIFTI